MKRFRKLLVIAGKIVGVFLLLVLVLVAEENLRGYLRLRRILSQLRAEGEPLTLADLRLPPIPKEGNAAPVLAQTAKALAALTKTNPLAGEGVRGLMSFVGPGQAVVQYRAVTYPAAHPPGERAKGGKAPDSTWEQLETELARGEVPLARLREVLRQPVVVSEVDYRGNKPFGAEEWKSAFWLISATLDALHREDRDAASANLVALLALVDYLRGDLHLTRQVIAVATEGFALNLVWEVCQSDGLTDAQLAAVQSALARQDFVNTTRASLALEQVQTMTYFDQFRQSGDGRRTLLRQDGHNIVDDLLSDREVEYPAEWKIWLHSMLWRLLWADQDQARTLELWQSFMADVHRLWSEKACAAFMQRTPPKRAVPQGFDRWSHPFTEILQPQIYRTVLERVMRYETQRQMTLAALALKRYALRNGGALPPSLDALVPDLLPEVPTDWMNGQPLRYRPSADGKTFLLYSVGTDGHDDGGDPTPAGTGKLKRNDLWSGRDAVWPTAVMVPEAASP